VSDLDGYWPDPQTAATGNGATGRKPRSEPTPEKRRRGKTARARGNAYEREVAHTLGGHRVGQLGTETDVVVLGWLAVQVKNGGAYPERIDRWLRAIRAPAGTLRAVVIGDAPGPGKKRRSLIVLDLQDFADWYGGDR
jgi:hypothetical protein